MCDGCVYKLRVSFGAIACSYACMYVNGRVEPVERGPYTKPGIAAVFFIKSACSDRHI